MTTPDSGATPEEAGPDGPPDGGISSSGSTSLAGRRFLGRARGRRTDRSHARHPVRMGPVRRTVREIGLALITAGVVILLFVLYQLLGTNLTEEHNQSNLAKQFEQAIAARNQPSVVSSAHPTTTSTTDQLPSVPTGGAIEHLKIPKIGVDKFVVEGTSEDDLRQGPGHYIGTPFPGEIGNVGIAGHRTTYGAPFFDLNELNTGDLIKITDLQDRTWVYKVSEAPQVVGPDDVAVLNPTTFAQLTLTTCNPRFSATSRLVVFARLVGRALPAPPHQTPPPKVTSLAGVDNLGSGDNNAWPPTILYGLLVVVGWIGTRLLINRSRRWYRLAAYVVGIGICIIPLWFAFENAILLLPQSI